MNGGFRHVSGAAQKNRLSLAVGKLSVNVYKYTTSRHNGYLRFSVVLLYGIHVESNRKCSTSKLHTARNGSMKLLIIAVEAPTQSHNCKVTTIFMYIRKSLNNRNFILKCMENYAQRKILFRDTKWILSNVPYKGRDDRAI
jgi:hypothetical protein